MQERIRWLKENITCLCGVSISINPSHRKVYEINLNDKAIICDKSEAVASQITADNGSVTSTRIGQTPHKPQKISYFRPRSVESGKNEETPGYLRRHVQQIRISRLAAMRHQVVLQCYLVCVFE